MVGGGDQVVKRDISVNSKGWSDFDKALRENGIVDPQACWYVIWVKHFKATNPAVPLGDRNQADVEGFLTALPGNHHLTTWMVDQASEALRVLYQQVFAAPWAWPWVCQARTVGDTAARKSPPHVATPEEEALLQRLRTEIRVRRYSPKTERAYAGWALRFMAFRRGRDPHIPSAELVREFLERLATVHVVAASTQNQALNALVFFLERAAGTPVGEIGVFPRAKRPQRLPVVLSPGEVRRLLDAMSGICALMAELLYGAGLRLAECASLRVRDLDFESNRITVHEGKGRKDRVTVFPHRARTALLAQLKQVQEMHERDAARGFGEAPLPEGVAARSPGAAPAYRGPSAATRCGTASRRTCWNPATTSARCRNCSATRTCRRR